MAIDGHGDGNEPVTHQLQGRLCNGLYRLKAHTLPITTVSLTTQTHHYWCRNGSILALWALFLSEHSTSCNMAGCCISSFPIINMLPSTSFIRSSGAILSNSHCHLHNPSAFKAEVAFSLEWGNNTEIWAAHFPMSVCSWSFYCNRIATIDERGLFMGCGDVW